MNTAIRDSNVEMVNLILEALEKEHEVLYSTLVSPIATYIMEILPEEQRDTNKPVSGGRLPGLCVCVYVGARVHTNVYANTSVGVHGLPWLGP